MKLCKDCRHYQPDGTNGLHGGSRCRREIDPIEGDPVHCDSSRRCSSHIIDPCGLDAAHFEAGVKLPDLSRTVRIVELVELGERPWWKFW